MKTNEKPINTEEKSFDAIKFVREQRDRLDAMFSKMTNEEIIAYLNKAQKTSTIRPSA
jgi:DNA polymerase/3'-5' exonuclease PolX